LRVPLYVSSSGQQAEYHQQIVDQIVDQIALGLLRPGDRLDTLVTVKAELHLAHATVARAYSTLEERGVISTAKRRGSVVAPISPQLYTELRREYAARQLRPLVDQLRRTRLKPRDIIAALKTLLDEETPQATSPDAE
jgi:GntR family transcriptional regulator